jgi:hypothetical protein
MNNKNQPRHNLLLQGSIVALFVAILPTAQSTIDTKLETGKFNSKEVSNLVFIVLGTSLSMIARHYEDPTVYTPNGLVGRNKMSEDLYLDETQS